MKSKLVMAIAFVLMSSAGYAVEEKNVGTAEFGALDLDGDGYLNEKELKAKKEVADQVDKLDKDKDGKLSEAEFGTFDTEAGMSGTD